MAKKRRTKTFFTFVICFVVICLCITFSVDNFMKINRMEKEKKELTKKLTELKEEQKILTDDVEKLKNPEYAARYAREKYFYSKTGEKILKIK